MRAPPRKNTLTPKQLRFLEHLVAYRRREGVTPTVREMQVFMGFRSPRSVGQYLDALEGSGLIERGPGARNIRILRVQPEAAVPDRVGTVEVPLVGSVAAGLPILAVENIEEYIPVSARLARAPHTYFLLRVRGDSMDRASIRDGDLVLVRHQPTAQSGDRVVALIDDSATVKVLRVGPDAIVLEPRSTNPRHRPIVLDRDFEVQGVVVATIPRSGAGSPT
ncbi:MAG: repressor LexA [Acidobacteria bacterium]|nr:repressor LexA [Acidobacteriota bacterium]